MRKYGKFFIPAIYVSVIIIMVLSVLLVINGVKSFLNEQEKPNYVLDDYFSETKATFVAQVNEETDDSKGIEIPSQNSSTRTVFLSPPITAIILKAKKIPL